VSEEKDVQSLLRKGIDAAREGNKAEARRYFEQVTELDDKNEKGWFWLASVVDSDEEKRVCLANVLFINPNNERAQKAMQQIEAKERQQKSDEEVIPGVSRRQLMLFGGGGLAAVVLILVVFIAITSSRNAAVAAQTQAAVELMGTSTGVALLQTAQSVAGTETQVALASPTPTLTNTPDRATLPPTFTPTAPPTGQVTATPLPLPSNFSGKIVGWSGFDVTQIGYLPIGVFTGNGQFTPISGDTVGRNPDFSGDAQRVIYTRYFNTTFDYGLEVRKVDGTEPQVVSQGIQALKSQMASFCSKSNEVAFVGLPLDIRGVEGGDEPSIPYQVFILNLDTKEVRRITNDKARYTYPAFSPDCMRIAAVRDELVGVNAGPDVVVLEVPTLTQTPITKDLGNFTESNPKWSPDGSKLVYAAYAKPQPGQPINNDIVITQSNGEGTPTRPVSDPSDDRNPVFSPDGRYIAFSSNRNGAFNIYVLDLTNNGLAQLTNSQVENYPGAWVP
jgi:Tol biopolymer transport system component